MLAFASSVVVRSPSIEDDLEALVVGNDDFDTVERSREVFCPFEAIGMVRQEIRHAHFLAYCLDPQRPHGFNAECLRAVMRAAARAQQFNGEIGIAGQLSPLDVHLMDLEKAQVRREWRSIDLLIVVAEERLVVAIELKIDAAEHSGQLPRYRTIVGEQWSVAAGWRHLFLFLTKNGDDASYEAEDWLNLTLEAVAQELQAVARRELGSPEARGLLMAYLAMLRRHHMPDDQLEALAAKLWGQHRQALEFLMDHRPDASDGVSGMLYNQRVAIADRMSEVAKLKIVLDDSSVRLMRFAVAEWDDLPDFLTARGWTASQRLMMIEIQRSSDSKSLRMRFALGPGEPEVRLRYYQALVNAGLPVGNRKQITGQWTRLASVKLADDLDEATDTAGMFETVVHKIAEYTRKTVLDYDRVLRSLQLS